MMIRTAAMFVIVFSLVTPEVLFANGRSVGVSGDDLTTSCICTDWDGETYQISNMVAETKTQGKLGALPAKKGIASADLSLIKLAAIMFDDNEADEQGYVKANVKFRHQDSEKKYMIFVGTAQDPVYLNGLNEDSMKITIELKYCKILEFQDIPLESIPKKIPLSGTTAP